ncbi:unnamed protein product [Urochloa decumbens]|uniref:Autophagy-related protein 13 N-terminal domain-containing protein n=1 Tax=Urochloa decumbens TaxID=240449 RepID=A0ABC9EH14_9POAL
MVPQFLHKALHAILAVRSPRPHASAAPAAAAAFRRRDRWFHLPLHAPPPPPAAEHLPEPSPGEPLVVDVYLAPSDGGGGAEEVVERWTVACEPWPSPAAAAAVGEGLAVNRAYKRCITLLRSLYAALRFLPAYRAFRTLCASGQLYNYEMGHRVGSFAAPFSRAEEAAMRTRRFAAVETQLGRLVVSVQYRPSLSAFNFEIKDSRDESGRFSGVFSSSGSPRLGFSRSSSRLSMQDDTDDADFPFAVDDVDPDSRPGSSSGKDAGDQAGSSSHKSQDAAVGYLVHLLKSARPLRDSIYSTHTSRAESIEAGSTSSFMSRRTSDALEELESFREIKENLLARSRSRLQDSLDKP